MLSIKSNQHYNIAEAGDVEVSHKNLAIGTIIVLVSIIALFILFTLTSIFQAINPLAAVTALTVTLIGITLFKRTSH